MLYVIATLAALLPVVLLLYYIYRQDSAMPEPIPLLWKGVGFGVLAAILVVVLLVPSELIFGIGGGENEDGAFNSIGDAVGTAFLDAAIPEEAAKLFMLWLLLRKNPYFDEHLDGIVYAACIGLGFAGIENVSYVLTDLDNLVGIAVARALFSVPGHFFFAVAMGYYVSLAHFSSKTRSEKILNYSLAYIVPMLLHGVFDSLLMTASVNEVFATLLFIVFLWFSNKLRKYAQARIRELKDDSL